MQDETIVEGYRLSLQQARLWLSQPAGGRPALAQSAVRLKGRLEPGALKAALAEIVGRHEILRTNFQLLPGLNQPLQVIQSGSLHSWREIDLSHRESLQQGAEVEDLLREEADRHFDLGLDPPARFGLIRLSESESVLVTSLPAMCADSQSLKHLLSEIAGVYAARLRGEDFHAQPVQYVDFAEWQREQLERETNSEDEANWEEPHAFPALPLMLGLEERGEASSRFEPGYDLLTFDPEITAAIERLAAASQISTGVLLLACWKILSWRLTGQGVITIETLSEGRGRGVQTALGAFASFRPVTTRLEPDYQLKELLAIVDRSIKSSDRRLARQLRLDPQSPETGGPAERTGVIGFEYEEWPMAVVAEGVEFSYWKQSVGLDRFKLKLGVFRSAEGLKAEIEYDASIFSAESIELIRERYLSLIESAVSNEAALIGDLEIIGKREREQVLEIWNETAKALPEDRWIHDLITAAAADRPDSIAISYQEVSLSYGELEGRSGRLASHLRSLGVGPESVVGVYLKRSPEMIVAVLGILKAGGAYLPLDAREPAERLKRVLKNAGARAVITMEELSGNLPAEAGAVVELDRHWSRIAERDAYRPRLTVRGDNLAYVIYTSGSTGTPKGVMVRHESVINLLEGLKTAIYGGEAEGVTVSLNAPLVFDSSVKQLIQMGRGCRLCIVPEEERLDAEKMLEYVRQQSIAVLDCTPSQLSGWLAAGLGKRAGDPEKILVGGEAIDERSWRRMSEARATTFYNVYGPTECTVDATVCEVRENETATIGRPINNLRLYLFDGNRRAAPIGWVGELYLGGLGTARGYLGDPGLTADRFVPDEYGKSGGRLYRTGDLGRYLKDGRVEYAGRRDEQVKIRGYRIELGEITEALKAHPGVREAAVIIREEQPGQPRLVGYAVAAGEVTESILKSHLREQLPEYMVPPAVVLLGALPLTRNGKVDKSALPEPERVAAPAESRDDHYRDAYEAMISGIWAEVLKVTHVDRDDNFFEIGGHSLLATQVISRIREVFGVKIGVRTIFEEPQLEGLARRIEKALRAGEKEEASPLIRASREGALPLSFAQQRLWFIEQLEPGQATYNIPAAVRLEGRLEIEILERVINEILRRHEVLRTRIRAEEGIPRQVIEDWTPRSLEVEDLTNRSPQEGEDEIRRAARAEAATGFDLSRGPLLKVKILKLEDELHVALFTMHHIVSDAWSMGILIREIGTLYRAYRAGAESPLDELEVQYADYAVWQRAYMTGARLGREVEYWTSQLKNQAVLALPADHSRPAAPSHRGGREKIELPPALSAELKRFSQREGATLFMTLMAAFKTLLMRYSGEEDVSIGTAIANRTRREIEGVIGFFVNTLVLRTHLGGNPSFRELVRREREAALGAYAHQEVPFEKLVEEINPERDLSRSPLFQVMMLLENAGRQELEIQGLKLSGLGEETGAPKFDLTLALTEGREFITGHLEYDRDLYDRESIRRMTRHYERVVAEVLRDAEQRIREIELMSEAEKSQVLVEWSQTESSNQELPPAHEMIRLQAARCADAIAVESERGNLSYRELNRRANQVGNYLRRKGIGREDLVGVCADRSLETAIALLGILKAGAAYVPIDSRYPAERVRYILKDASVRLLLTRGRMAERIENPELTAEVIDLESGWEEILSESAESPEGGVDGDHPAYVIYTSGSTGKPKGVMIRHGGLANYLKWATEAYRIMEGEGAPINSSFSFDLTVTSLYVPLVGGKRVTMLSEEEGLESLSAAMLREGAYSLVKITPAHLELLTEQMKDHEIAGRARALVIGGEQLKVAGLKEWRNRAPETRLINEYGPTETVVGCCVYEVSGGESSRDAVPIGKPITNVQMYLLDAELEPVPAGVSGEIYISGAGLARGYRERSDLTAERFIPRRFGGNGGERMYRTGDLGRHLADGNIEYLGRADDQVKVRGYRIELGEIEAVLQEHPSVRQSVVVANEDERRGTRLLGYVTGASGMTGEELKRHLRERVPEYLIPEAIMILEELPVTANGKIDRKRLPPIVGGGRPSDPEPIGSGSPVEEIVAGTFARVLNLPQVGRDESFFELGGHSLLAMQVVSGIKTALGLELPLRTLFELPTVRGLAEKAESTLRQGLAMETPVIGRADRSRGLPLSFEQQRLWFIDRLNSDQAVYLCPSVLRLEGRLDLEVLERAINEILRRHEVLRMRIASRGGLPEQVIEEWTPRPLELADLTDLAPDEREAALRKMTRDESETGFDLSRGPLVRVKVVKLEPELHVMFFTMHHIVTDGWSMGILFKEIGALYLAYLKGEPSPLPELEIQYADYAVWQRDWLSGQTLERLLHYWREQLSDLKPLELPLDYPRPAATGDRGASLSFEISEKLTDQLRRLSRAEGVTLFITLLAAFKTLLMRSSGQEDIAVGSPIANRTRAETERLIGFFANTLVLRTRVDGDSSFKSLLQRVREVCLGAYAHQDLPFDRLVEELRPERELGETPLFQAMFAFQQAPRTQLEIPDLTLALCDIAPDTAKFDLCLGITETARQVQASLRYNREIF
ncbi:MAG TPA: amino acid adenylation domain-containing protein, partial [Blastocatellia bacterium]|nr:amino acid adenylation domain-containing protein [Blastocatellia bacterium]